MRLSLSVTIWLPDNASKELSAPRGGAPVDRRNVLRRRRKGRAADGPEVDRQEAQGGGARREGGGAVGDRLALSDKLCQDYLDAINVPCERAQVIYDRLTDHGGT